MNNKFILALLINLLLSSIGVYFKLNNHSNIGDIFLIGAMISLVYIISIVFRKVTN